MNWKKFLKKERILWHHYFIPAALTALVVAFISFIYEMNLTNIVLFASVGASAAILSHSRSHHLTKLRTSLIAYIIAILISAIVYLINLLIPLHMSINIFLMVFLVSLALVLFNVFHPPAIGASISFILLQRPLIDLFYLFIVIIVSLTLVRLIVYVISQHLSVKDFFKEFL